MRRITTWCASMSLPKVVFSSTPELPTTAQRPRCIRSSVARCHPPARPHRSPRHMHRCVVHKHDAHRCVVHMHRPAGCVCEPHLVGVDQLKCPVAQHSGRDVQPLELAHRGRHGARHVLERRLPHGGLRRLELVQHGGPVRAALVVELLELLPPGVVPLPPLPVPFAALRTRTPPPRQSFHPVAAKADGKQLRCRFRPLLGGAWAVTSRRKNWCVGWLVCVVSTSPSRRSLQAGHEGAPHANATVKGLAGTGVGTRRTRRRALWRPTLRSALKSERERTCLSLSLST